ncbi:hypothetical protein D9613_007407 [Agrocybe pediades]|uniref:Uncharacterized protein n=1 Tax=Agrocybe pediades TaxID=84607 RepID=A0A8H4QMQ5_9AGAR|nr:hypothetical protein D9613_007407 [Agrocybe pediades]
MRGYTIVCVVGARILVLLERLPEGKDIQREAQAKLHTGEYEKKAVTWRWFGQADGGFGDLPWAKENIFHFGLTVVIERT